MQGTIQTVVEQPGFENHGRFSWFKLELFLLKINKNITDS